MFLPQFRPVIRNDPSSSNNTSTGDSSHVLVGKSLIARVEAERPASTGQPGQYNGPSGALITGIICSVMLVIAVGTTAIVQFQKRRRKARDMASVQSQPDVIKYTKELEKHTDSMRPIPIGQQITLPRHPQTSYSVSSFNSAQSRASQDTTSTDSLVPQDLRKRLEDVYLLSNTNVKRGRSDLSLPASVKPKVDEKHKVQTPPEPSTASSGVDPLPSPRRRVGLPSTPSPRTSQFAEMQKHGAVSRRTG